MRVLMVTPGLPQPTGGGAAIRNWHILRHLVMEMGARVQVLTFGDATAGAIEPLPSETLVTMLPAPRRDWRRRLRVLAATHQPDLADRLWTAEAQTRVIWQALHAGVDVVHIGGLELGRHALEIAQHRPLGAGPAIVLDEYNAEHVLQRRAWQTDIRAPRRWPVAGYSAVQWWRLRRFERAVCRAADAISCVSEADAASLRSLRLPAAPLVIPNGVDTDRYRLAGADAGTWHFDVLFSGTFDYRPNIDAAIWLVRAVWPLLRARFPALTLGLVGQRPGAAVRALEAAPGVTVTGPVPDDRPYLWGATMYGVPMRYGGGARLKLLNALAAGCPVISTTMGAEGVSARHGQDLLLADTPDQWARAAMRLLTEPALRRQLIENGRALVERHYDWRALTRRLDAVYGAALRRRGELADALA